MSLITEHIQPVLDRKLPAALVAMMMISAPAWSEDHLTPGAEIVEGYESGVSGVLKGAFTDDLDSLAIIEPSFQPEFAVGVRAKEGKYRVFYIVAKEEVWPKLLGKKPLDHIGTNNCEVGIRAELGLRIGDVWDAMLRKIGPDPSATPALDGSSYYFSRIVDGKLRVGMAWDAGDNSKVGRMENVAYAMRDLCVTKGTQKKLDDKVVDLERFLAVEKMLK